ncbi:MAG: hypothetical protein V4465_03150, partial [Patescibacteria group bacterium]
MSLFDGVTIGGGSNASSASPGASANPGASSPSSSGLFSGVSIGGAPASAPAPSTDFHTAIAPTKLPSDAPQTSGSDFWQSIKDHVGGALKTASDFVGSMMPSKSPLGALQDLIEPPTAAEVNSVKPGWETTALEFPSTLAENLPIVGPIVAAAHNDPETLNDVTLKDTIGALPEAGQELVKGFIAEPIVTLAGAAIAPFSTKNAQINVNIPGLGQVTNAQYRVAQDIQDGTPPWLAVTKEAPTAIFDGLMFASIAEKITMPRPETVMSAEAPEGVSAKSQPSSFRMYREPVATNPMTDEQIQTIAKQKGITLPDSYKPDQPTYFRVTGKGNGKVIGELVQIRPSYLEEFKSKFGGNASRVPEQAVLPVYQQETSVQAIQQGMAEAKGGPEISVGTPQTPAAPQVSPDIQKGIDDTVAAVKEAPAVLAITEKAPTAAEKLPALFHGTSFENADSIDKNGIQIQNKEFNSPGLSLSTSADTARAFGGRGEPEKSALFNASLKPDAKIADLGDMMKQVNADNFETKSEAEDAAIHLASKQGFDAIDLRDAKSSLYKGHGEIRVFNKDAMLVQRAAGSASPAPKEVSPEKKKREVNKFKNKNKKAITRAEGALQKKYANSPEAHEHLGQVLVEMELAEKGRRDFVDTQKGMEVRAISSTFPKWVPEDLRSKSLFEKVIPDLNKIKYPTGSRQRDLYNAILSEVNDRAGIDTKDIRSDIMQKHEDNLKGENAGPNDRSAQGSEGRGELDAKKEADKIFGEEVKTPQETKTESSSPVEKAVALNGLENDIPLKTAIAAHEGTSMYPEKRGQSRIDDYVQTLTYDYEELKKYADTPEKQAILDKQFTALREGYRDRKIALLNAEGRTISPMITGPANFPVAKNRTRLDAANKKREEMLDFEKRMMNKIKNEMNPRTFNGTDQKTIDDMSKRLQELKDTQSRMKEANKIIQKGENVSAELEKLGYKDTDIKALMDGDFAGRKGFPSYALTSVNNKIKTLEKRLEDTSAKREKADTTGNEVMQYGDTTITKNFDENRVQVTFKERPDQAMIDKLKARGFKWSPTNNAWQRILTNKAVYDAKILVKDTLTPDQLEDAREAELLKKAPKGNASAPLQKDAYKGEKDLTIGILQKLEGRTTVSKQFISDLSNSAELKQNERDIVRDVLNQYPDKKDIPVKDFAKKVKAELLPLDFISSEGTGETKYENITLPDEERGPVSNYEEHIYQSPVKTSAGNIHFRDEQNTNYFGHTRIEDLPISNKTKYSISEGEGTKDLGIYTQPQGPAGDMRRIADGFKTKEEAQKHIDALPEGGTRRVIEVQSDLYQKGGLEKEEEKDLVNDQREGDVQTEGFKKLKQYNNPTAHFRMVREEVKQAAVDGKTKLQFPTGETAMKIEGLGDKESWSHGNDFHAGMDLLSRDLTPDIIGKEVTNLAGIHWIITDVLGDGKFKAIQKRYMDDMEAKLAGKLETFSEENLHNVGTPEGKEKYLNALKETFDISGKIDTNNPIYRFYEKDLARYLKSTYGAKTITDPQGVTWNEVKVDPLEAYRPVQAFSKGAGDMQSIEQGISQYVSDNKASLMKEYEAENGIVYNVDKMKELLPGHAENRTMSEAFHTPAAQLIGEMVREAIDKNAGSGKKIVFFAGSPGAGKTMAIDNYLDMKDERKNLGAVIDGTLASDRSLNEMKRALGRGEKVDIYYVDSSPEQILKNLVKRAQDGGRTVPIETVFNAFLKSRQNIFKAMGRFDDNPNFNVHLIDNTELADPKFPIDPIDHLKSKPYTENTVAALKNDAYSKLDKLYEQNKITKEIYEGFTRRRGELAPSKSAGRPKVRSFTGEESQEESRRGTQNVIGAQGSVSSETPMFPKEQTRIGEGQQAGQPTSGGHFLNVGDKTQSSYEKSIAKTKVPDNGSMTLNMEIIPGLNKTIAEDIMPNAKATVGGIKSAMKEIATWFNPTGAAPKEALDIMMKNKGDFERHIFRLEQATKNIKKMWDKQPEAARLDFMHKVETGEAVPEEFKAIADMYRERLDNLHNELLNYKDVNFLENFFPHFWEDKDQEGIVRKFIPGMVSRRPLQGPKPFMKERVFENIQEGIKAGFKLRTSNPEELMQTYETNVKKFVMAQNIKNDMTEKGFWKFVPMGEKPPTDFVKINDAIAEIYYKENKTLTEFYDEHLMNSLNNLAKDLGIKHERLLTFKGRGKRGAAGLSMTGKNEVWTKFGSPENVLMHEIGHQIDDRYGLKDKLVMDPTYKKELRALADKRMGDVPADQISDKDKAYIRKGEEKMAVMFEAYLHAPDMFKEVAPKTYQWFLGFMGSHSELRPILDLKPSLVLGSNQKTLEGPMIKGGEYYAQKDAARLVNNHLSRDFIYETALGTGMMNIKNTLNTFQLGFSAFHLTMETLDTVVTKFGIGLSRIATGHAFSGLADIAKSPIAPYSFFKDGQKFFNDDPMLKDIEKAIFTGGASLKARQYYKNTVFDTFMKNAREGNYLGAMFRAPLAAVEATMRPLFSYYIPRLKVGAFRDLYAQQLQQFSKQIQSGEMTQDQVARMSWNNIENRMGEINYDNLFWNRTLKSSAMLMFRSVGWNLGTIREIGGAVLKDLPGEAKKAAGGKGFTFTSKMSYVLSLFFVTGIIGAIYEYLHTGQGPSGTMDLYYPKNGAKTAAGDDQRVEFPTYLKDIWQYTHQPIQTVADKFAPEFTALIELLRNKDFYGDDIRNTNDNLGDQAKQVAVFMADQFIPFSVANVNQQLKGQSTTEQNIESFLGIVNAPKAAIQTSWQAGLAQIYTDQVGQSGPRTPEQKAIDLEKAKARQEIKNGNYDTLKQLLLQGVVKPAGVKKFIADSKLNTNQRMYEGLSKENKAKFNDTYGDQLKNPSAP